MHIDDDEKKEGSSQIYTSDENNQNALETDERDSSRASSAHQNR